MRLQTLSIKTGLEPFRDLGASVSITYLLDSKFVTIILFIAKIRFSAHSKSSLCIKRSPMSAVFFLMSATIPKRASLQQAQRHSQNNIQDPFNRSGIK